MKTLFLNKFIKIIAKNIHFQLQPLSHPDNQKYFFKNNKAKNEKNKTNAYFKNNNKCQNLTKKMKKFIARFSFAQQRYPTMDLKDHQVGATHVAKKV